MKKSEKISCLSPKFTKLSGKSQLMILRRMQKKGDDEQMKKRDAKRKDKNPDFREY